jgi:hypothetical protein
LKLIFAKLTSHPAIQIRLVVASEHLKADGQWNIDLLQGLNGLELSVVMTLKGVEFTHEYKASLSQVFDYFGQRYDFAVCYLQDFFRVGTVAPQEKENNQE